MQTESDPGSAEKGLSEVWGIIYRHIGLRTRCYVYAVILSTAGKSDSIYILLAAAMVAGRWTGVAMAGAVAMVGAMGMMAAMLIMIMHGKSHTYMTRAAARVDAHPYERENVQHQHRGRRELYEQ